MDVIVPLSAIGGDEDEDGGASADDRSVATASDWLEGGIIEAVEQKRTQIVIEVRVSRCILVVCLFFCARRMIQVSLFGINNKFSPSIVSWLPPLCKGAKSSSNPSMKTLRLGMGFESICQSLLK